MVWCEVPMDMDVRGSHGWCMNGWHVDEIKSPLGTEEWVGFVHDPQRGLEAHKEADSHMMGRLLGYMCEWSPTLNKDEKNEWLI